MGKHLNRIDAKGRVSIPAQFRAVLRARAQSRAGGDHAEQAAASLVLRPSHNFAAIEGWPEPDFTALATPLGQMDVFGADHSDMATALYAEACPVDPDKEGRIVLPDTLIVHAGLAEGVMFMGIGGRFEIWEPAAGEHRLAEARERARIARLTLPGAARAVPA